MLAALLLASLQTFPARDHQPLLRDPGLHGGRIKNQHPTQFPVIYDGPGDFTPDGRVFISFRQQQYSGSTYLWALVASTTDPEKITANAGGHLGGFYDPAGGVPGDEFFGQGYALSEISESKVIYWSPPFFGADTETTSDDTCGLDPGLPLPNAGKLANVALAMRPLDPSGPERGENPYPSGPTGSFQLDGGYRTYKLWLVTDHYHANVWTCTSPTVINVSTQGEGSYLVGLNLTVIVDRTGAEPSIHSVAVQKPFTPLRIGDSGMITPMTIQAVEPSIVADGTLIIFNGNGAANDASQSKTTYVWNPVGCSAGGWSPPLSITQVPPATYPGTPEEFARSYAFSKYPIREPDNYAYFPGELLGGPYPWISKDGSFFIAMHVRSTEALQTSLQLPRSGMFVCGDITGGYIKHIDDAALNPTRLGGSMYWPQTAGGDAFLLQDTGRTTVFTTGLKPGLWEPLLGEGVPVPDQEASERIPVLPLFVHRTRQYGEVRFEEADGNYLLYLACNESFMENDCLEPFECALTNREMDPRSTPDTSGRTLRALCALNPGAAFPQEVAGTLTSPNSAAVRQMIGAAIGGAQLSLHENAGYKGQAIGFSSEGHVAVTGGSWTSYGSHLTVQAFVKVVTPTIGSDLMLVEDAGRFSLQLRADGSVRATVVVTGAGGTKQVTSPTGVVVPAQPVANPGVGWRHLALVYDGDETVTVNKVASNASTLMLYGDGVLLASLQWLENSSIANPPSFPLYVGPGRGVPTQNVSAANLKLLLDEVAISRVARTTDELRRDAYVPPVPSPFEPLPSAISLPVGLERSESKWPLGLAYSSSKVALGDALFESPLLSKNLDRSCATCHIPTDFFADANQVATAEDPPHLPLTFNVPTALNMSFGTHKLFDGSAATLEEQSVRPIKGPEMGPQAIGSVLTRIKNNAPLRALFDAAYPPLPNNAHVNEANLKESLAMYVRTFLTGGSAFDLDGQVRHGSAGTPLGAAAHRGRSLFFGKARCFGCHRGSNLSDDAFHNIGTVGASESILGRGGFTGRSSENGQLKTPTLRNVAQTGPWFHDGTLVSLHDVVAHYNAGFASAGGIGSLDRQLRPLGLTLGEIDDLVAFLGSLTGTVTP